MSLFRRSFSRRMPDRLLEISERIYVFDCCLSTSVKTENEYKSYMGAVVASLHNFHPGASCMVFNFREEDQGSSLLSDILIDYDMTVVDYPRHYDGYPLLPLEMIHYFLRSGESWLSLEGNKNVILMHCEPGGWPVLAFMLAGLLLYRKQYTGEQKTLEMVYKQAPKDLFSTLSPINPQASQMRYLKYITGRDLASDWPPSDAPLIVDYLLLRNLPLFDGGKGCRPVVRVYGQDSSAKANRSPRLLFSSLMADEPAWQYPKEECTFVKLGIHCQVQGDVFLECIHLCEDLVSEEIIFKIMFHTGFTQSNILALNSSEIDVPWNTQCKIPKDFKAEVLFRDINEHPYNITMEPGTENITLDLGTREDGYDSDNEFFEVEEIFTPMSESQERKVDSSTIVVQVKELSDKLNAFIAEERLLDDKSKDCTLRNGAPRWDLEAAEVTNLRALNEIFPEAGHHKKATVVEPEVSESKNNVMIDESQTQDMNGYDQKQASEAETIINASKNNIMVDVSHIEDDSRHNKNQTSEADSDIYVSKNIKVVDESHIEGVKGLDHKRSSEVESKVIVSKDIIVVGESQIQDVTGHAHEQTSNAESDVYASKSVLVVDESQIQDVNEHDHEHTSKVTLDEIESKNIVVVDGSETQDVRGYNHKETPEAGSNVASNNVADIDGSHIQYLEGHDHKQTLEADFDVYALKDVLVVDKRQIQDMKDDDLEHTSKAKLDVITSKNIVVVDGSETQDEQRHDHTQTPEAEFNVASIDIGLVDGRQIQDVVKGSDHKQPLEASSDIYTAKNIEVVDDSEIQDVKKHDHKPTSESNKDVTALKNTTVVDKRHILDIKGPDHKQTSVGKSNVGALKNIVVVDGSQRQDVKVEIEPKSAPSSAKPPKPKKNRWQDITAKTIKQQRVVSQWVPRAKASSTEPPKPKAPAYKWVPKEATAPEGP